MMDGNESVEKDDCKSLPPPKFESKPSVYRGRITCQICFTSCLEKNKTRSKIEKISDVDIFKEYAQRWKDREHDYSKVFDLVDWNNNQQKMAHKSCKGSFFKESYLQSQRTTLENSLDETENEAPTSDSNETCLRKSSRKSLQYQSTQVERKCIICNEDRFIKGRLVPLQNVSLARDGRYKAEETLKEFASIHLQNNNKKYVDGANRILLTLNTASLFAANVSYHKSLCYDPFRSPWWKKKRKEEDGKEINIKKKKKPFHFHQLEPFER